MSKVEIYHKKSLSLDLIEETFNASFSVSFDREYWKWRFLDNPNKDKVYISYIIENNTLAAYYAVSPMILNINGKKEKVALSNMTMTHPDYRGKGYFKKLASELFKNLKLDGFTAVYGFANHNSHYGFRKYLNWQDLSSLSLFNVSPESFRNVKTNNSLEIETSEINEEIINKIDDFIVTDSESNFIDRSSENIRWRLKNNPSNKYKVQVCRQNNKIISLLFYKNYLKDIDILEYFYDSKIDSIENLIQNISKLIQTTESNINLWSNIHSKEHISLERQGFMETQFITYFGVIPLQENIDLLNYKKWHYRFLDSDIF